MRPKFCSASFHFNLSLLQLYFAVSVCWLAPSATAEIAGIHCFWAESSWLQTNFDFGSVGSLRSSRFVSTAIGWICFRTTKAVLDAEFLTYLARSRWSFANCWVRSDYSLTSNFADGVERSPHSHKIADCAKQFGCTFLWRDSAVQRLQTTSSVFWFGFGIQERPSPVPKQEEGCWLSKALLSRDSIFWTSSSTVQS